MIKPDHPSACRLLVHTDDAARGLCLRFSPDPDIAGRVLGRLFSWHDADAREGLAELAPGAKPVLLSRSEQSSARSCALAL